MSRRKRLFAALAALALCVSGACAVAADTETAAPSEPSPDAVVSQAAQNITSSADISAWGDYDYSLLTDDNVATNVHIGYGDTLTVVSETPIAGIYLKFYVRTSAWTVEANGQSIDCGQHSFVHEYVDVAAKTGAATQLSITFPRGADVSEIAFYSEGVLPDDVQTWELPLVGCADLLMFSSHADDEQLFFSGVLPDAVARGAACEVVYFCDHSGEPARVHEQLNGLWAVGVRYYPVLGKFPDLYSESKEQADAVFAEQGYGEEDFLEWQVENIRRFRPQVLVIHDEAGEYGHGTHIINSETAREAVALAADSSAYSYSLMEYGTWDVPKVYMHLYAQNEIILDFDRPLEYFGGRTAYEMSCLGFAEHQSQHWTWFYKWMYGIEQEQAADPTAPRFTSATQITTYSPCRWGLWRSLVGSDETNDMFDHIKFYLRESDVPAETETQSEAPETEILPQTQSVAGESPEKPDEPGADQKTIIIIVCAAAALIAIVIAAAAISNKRRRERERKAEKERRARRSDEQMRRIKEARDERARREATAQSEALRTRAAQRTQARSDAAASPRPTANAEAAGRAVPSSAPTGERRAAATQNASGERRDAPSSRADAIRAARAARAAQAAQGESAGRCEDARSKPTDKQY